jgi:hypothetical protein
MEGVKLLEKRMNTGARGRLPKSKRLALKPGPDGIIVTREKKAQPATSVWLDGKEYRRSHQFDNLSSEKLVRINLARFVEGVKDAVKAGLSDGRLVVEGDESENPAAPGKAEPAGWLRNSIFDVEKICADFDGIGVRGFVDSGGKQLSHGKAFRNAITQFFKDEDFALAVCRVAIFEYLTKSTS